MIAQNRMKHPEITGDQDFLSAVCPLLCSKFLYVVDGGCFFIIWNVPFLMDEVPNPLATPNQKKYAPGVVESDSMRRKEEYEMGGDLSKAPANRIADVQSHVQALGQVFGGGDPPNTNQEPLAQSNEVRKVLLAMKMQPVLLGNNEIDVLCGCPQLSLRLSSFIHEVFLAVHLNVPLIAI